MRHTSGALDCAAENFVVPNCLSVTLVLPPPHISLSLLSLPLSLPPLYLSLFLYTGEANKSISYFIHSMYVLFRE